MIDFHWKFENNRERSFDRDKKQFKASNRSPVAMKEKYLKNKTRREDKTKAKRNEK